jgi:hypothetical protein
MATAAVFVALGGGAYAATALPRNSVGPAQLRTHAVSGPKLADRAVSARKIARRAVTISRLSNDVRRRLDRRAATGPAGAQGPKGDTGPAGPAGADALGARRIRFDAAATATPADAVALDMPGLELRATCTLSGNGVAVALSAKAPEDAVLQANFTVDSGTDPATPDPNAGTANIQQALVGGDFTPLNGPGTQTGYARVNARAVLVGQSRTITLELFEFVDAGTQRCSIGGTALPSS